MRPEDVVATVWPGRTFDIEPLGGGITNHNFKVTFEGGEAVVVRAPGKDTELLGIDRQVESAAARMAASIGVGPEVVAFVAGCLITRFIEGFPVPPELMRRPGNLARTAGTLRAIHEGPLIPGRFDSFRVVELYAATAAEHGVEPPPDYAWARGVAGRIEAARGPQPTVPGHNDLLNANFIDDGEHIRIVDWEYAGMSDRFFDLANFSVNHELDTGQDRLLLAAYRGADATDRDLANLRLMRFMSDFREAMWGVVQQSISELEVDFVAYANRHFQRLRATAADPAFEDWLSSASA
ncbi:MAG TPA: choline kinase family protein [Actinomycetota bacterium]